MDLAHGEYIAFLDSDDWLEQNAIKKLVQFSILYDADIVACRSYKEWANATEESQMSSLLSVYDGKKACCALICQGNIGQGVWNKLYRAKLFSIIRFPKGHVFEDISVTYRLLLSSEKVVWIPDMLIHYRVRISSISHTNTLKNIEDGWRAIYDLYSALNNEGICYHNALIQTCIKYINIILSTPLSCYNKDDFALLSKKKELYHKMKKFVHMHVKEVLTGDFPFKTKCLCVLLLCNRFGYINKRYDMIKKVKKAFRKGSDMQEKKEMFP